MELPVYAQFHALERGHWWFRGMRDLGHRMLALAPPGGGRCLDVGCGTGLWTRQLERYGPVVALDFEREALRFSRDRGVRALVRGGAERLPFRDGSFRLVTALGLIEHLDDDAAFLREIRRVLEPGGRLLLLTSAYRFLWSRHDDLVHHRRRYLGGELDVRIRSAGLELVHRSHANALLLAPIVLVRVVRRLLSSGRPAAEGGASPDFYLPPRPVNQFLEGILLLESRLATGVGLPFGVGLVALARRPAEEVCPPAVRRRTLPSDLASAFRRAPLAARLRIVGRWFLCPFAAVLRHLPETGRFLDVGCGDGLLFWLAARLRPPGAWEGVGIDHDPGKIAVARTIARPGIRFEDASLASMPGGAFDRVTMMDVLYCVPPEGWDALLAGCARALAPGGRLIVKDVVDEPRWKSWFTRAQEAIAVTLLGMTKGARPHVESRRTFESALERAGLRVVEVERIDRGRPYGHALFVAEKPGTSP